MPERTPTINPTVFAGTALQSGTPNTGQILMSFGGQKVFTKLSGGAGGTAVVHVGAGRLDAIVIHPPSARTVAVGADVNSGLALTFLDQAVVLSGSLGLSGEPILWKGLADYEATVSGGFRCGRTVAPLGMPFSSGLAFSSTSGQDGFSLVYTPVVSGV